MPNNIIDSIQLSGTVYTLSAQTGGGGVPESAFTAYTAATDERISQDEEVTAAALNELNEALSGKQDTLSAGTNITISGNVISAEGGGKAIEAGRGISITTGEAADTVSFNLPISAGTGTNSIVEGHTINIASGNYSHAEGRGTTASGYVSHAEGYYTTASGSYSHAEGNSTTASGSYSHAEGYSTSASNYSHSEGYRTTASGINSHAEGQYTETTNQSEHASGQYNVSSSGSSTWGDSGNTLFSVGNGDWSARHNAFEIRQNGDIYLSSGGTDIKLQDHLGGGGSSYTAGDGIDITNDVISVTGKTDSSAFTAHTADTTIHVTSTEKAAWNAKSDFSGDYNDLANKPTIPTVPTSNTAFTNDARYITIDAISGKVDTSTYNTYTAATDTTLASKADTATTYTKTETDNAVTAATSTKQDTLVSGTNIKTINNESILGSGNITIEGGGGKAIVGGRGITVTSGETADTVSFNLPISAGTNSSNLIIVGERCVSNGSRSIATGFYTKAQQSDAFAQGYKTDAGQEQSHAEGYETKAYGVYSHSEGRGTSAMTAGSHAEGIKTITSNSYEHSQGWYNVSNKTSNTFGDSGNTLFSVGNGTADNARHNAFEIRQNGDIYLNDGSKLQDTVSATTANTTALGGLKLVKLSQSEYDSLATKDNSTLYVIVN